MEIPLQLPPVPTWQGHALDDPALAGVALPAELVEIFRLDALRDIEWSGYLVGVMRDGVFNACSHVSLCNGKTRTADGDERRAVSLFPEPHINRVFYECLTQALLRILPDAKTMLYHCHPRTGERVLRSLFDGDADMVLRAIDNDLEAGVYDYLGGSPTLDDAINESVARQLSQDDIDATHGNGHLLITDTPVYGHQLAHLNVYRLEGASREPALIRVTVYEAGDDPFLARLAAAEEQAFRLVTDHFTCFITPQLEDMEHLHLASMSDERMEEILKAAPSLELPFFVSPAHLLAAKKKRAHARFSLC